jgi:amino acid adenylation domain-containing protein
VNATGPLMTSERFIFPCAFSQRRLWLIDQLEMGRAAYNMAVAVRLSGRLDIHALEESLNEVTRRHEILRTYFAEFDGEPVQVVSPSLSVEMPVIDLTRLPAAARDAQARRMSVAEARLAFDLANLPLLRARLIRLDSRCHILLLTMHHIISDGWSVEVLIRECSILYEAYTTGMPAALPDLPIQYADFVLWQEEWLSGQILTEELAYWKQQLAGIPASLELPADRPRPAVLTYTGAHFSFEIPGDIAASLNRLSQANGVTLFMLLLAAFKTLLFRYSDEPDIVVGTPIANRSQAETENLIGLLVNTLALRTRLSASLTFRELLMRVRQVALGAYAHPHLPFEMLVEALQPDRALSHSPIFQVMFLFENVAGAGLKLPGLDVSLQKVDNGTSKFDLSLVIAESDQGLRGLAEYSTDLFDEATLARMINHYRTLLEAVAARADQPIADLPLLTEPERLQILSTWNQTRHEYAAGSCLHHLFEAQAAATPHSIAVSFDDQRMSYQELNARANQMAHFLASLGVGPEARVGICLERSLDMVVALLGVLKAGGAYVPMDPIYPRDRLALMMQDAGITVLLTQTSLQAALPGSQAGAIYLDVDFDKISRFRQDNPSRDVTPENCCYVIYTSGSTGRPKGVQIEHRSVVNFLSSMRRELSFSRDEKLLSVTTLSFDIAGLEIYLPLICGAHLLIASREVSADGGALAAMLERSGATTMQATPVSWRMLIDGGWQGHASLKALCGGEPLPLELAVELKKRAGSLWNLYGPTETTIWSTAHRLDDDPKKVSLGRPIANTQVYLLDERLQPVPIGVTGELFIAGDGLARGYLDRPDLSAERFMANPFSDAPGARMYQTGDLCKYDTDGTILYLSRADHQVKIRGYRIELGEIESCLEAYASIERAVVLVREDTRSNKRLVAYVTLRKAQRLDLDQLRWALKDRLPEYMIPSGFVVQDEWPLTPNGKIDRKALHAPADLPPGLRKDVVAPHHPIEEMVADIWREVLGIGQIGIHDNFFNLGGHSLAASQVASRIRESLRVDLPLRDIFEAPDIARLAKRIEARLGVRQNLVTEPISRVPRTGSLPLSYAQHRLWFLNWLELGNPAYNIIAATRLAGELNLAALIQSLDMIIQRHEILRTKFVEVEGFVSQVIQPEMVMARSIIDLTTLPTMDGEREAQRAIHDAGRQPFDLGEGPLIRACVVKLNPQDHYLVLTAHHIVFDDWSVGVLARELSALYGACCSGEVSPLPEPRLQYADFAAWQRRASADEAVASELSYWRAQLSGSLPLLNIPSELPRPSLRTSRGNHADITLPAPLVDELRALSRREGATLFMTLLAAFNVLLYGQAAQEEILIGTPVAGRNRVELEELIGCFINTLVLRIRLSDDLTFSELIGRVKAVALGAYANQDAPFERVVEQLKLPRDPSRTPLFQAMFSLHNTPYPALNLGGLTSTPIAVNVETAKYDLLFNIHELPTGLLASLEYNADLFKADRIALMLTQFETLLSRIAAGPAAELKELVALIGDLDRQQKSNLEKELEQTRLEKFERARRKRAASFETEKVLRTD